MSCIQKINFKKMLFFLKMRHFRAAKTVAKHEKVRPFLDSMLSDKLKSLIWFGLVCWVLWHINLCRLFNAKSIFM